MSKNTIAKKKVGIYTKSFIAVLIILGIFSAFYILQRNPIPTDMVPVVDYSQIKVNSVSIPSPFNLSLMKGTQNSPYHLWTYKGHYLFLDEGFYSHGVVTYIYDGKIVYKGPRESYSAYLTPTGDYVSIKDNITYVNGKSMGQSKGDFLNGGYYIDFVNTFNYGGTLNLIKNDKVIYSRVQHDGFDSDLHASPDGKDYLLRSNDWIIRNGKVIYKGKFGYPDTNGFKVSPNTKHYAIASQSKKPVTLVVDGKLFKTSNNVIYINQITDDGHILYAAYDENASVLTRFIDNKPVQTSRRDSNYHYVVLDTRAFITPDGNHLLLEQSPSNWVFDGKQLTVMKNPVKVELVGSTVYAYYLVNP